MATDSEDVPLSGEDRKWPLDVKATLFDPGCVKTCTSQECVELFSLSSSLSRGRKHFWFSKLRNRDGISTRRLNAEFSRGQDPRRTSDSRHSSNEELSPLAGRGLLRRRTLGDAKS